MPSPALHGRHPLDQISPVDCKVGVYCSGLYEGTNPEVDRPWLSRRPCRFPSRLSSDGRRKRRLTALVASRALLGPLAASEALRLFVERAWHVRPDFALAQGNAAAVAAIRQRLDGLQLIIELAAARVRRLPRSAPLVRLAYRLPLVTGGSRHHQVPEQIDCSESGSARRTM
jgi:hypothetical protein